MGGGGALKSFRRFTECFDNLGKPLNWLTAPKAYRLRRYLMARLKVFHQKHLESRQQSAQHRINSVFMHDPHWNDNPDYFGVELISAVGFLVTPSTLTVWTMRHLLARPDLLDTVVRQIRNIPALGTRGRADLRDVNETAPGLVAAWYEALRLHMTGVPRLARRSFELTVPQLPGRAYFQKGDIIMLPMYTGNRDVSIFGPDVEAFRPERFLDKQGRLLKHKIRKINCFGVAGNLCPGRDLGLAAALSVLVEIFRRYEIEQASGGRFEVPEAADGIAVGFQRYQGDVGVKLTAIR